jgi:virulence-associated protein VagC
MPRTRVFKSGNSQAVRIPAELAYGDTLRRMPKPRRVEKRKPIEVPLRSRD